MTSSEIVAAHIIDRMILAALATSGVPYVWGGNHPDDGGMDCSGACRHWLQLATGQGYRDRMADQWYQECEPCEKQRGCWAFYGTPTRATHMVLLLTDDGRAVIGANGGGRPGEHETDFDYDTRMTRRSAMVRIEGYGRGGYLYRRDFLGFRRPLGV